MEQLIREAIKDVQDVISILMINNSENEYIFMEKRLVALCDRLNKMLEVSEHTKTLLAEIKELVAENEKIAALLLIQNTQLTEPVPGTYTRSASFNKQNTRG